MRQLMRPLWRQAARRPARPARSTHVRVQALEDRCLMSVFLSQVNLVSDLPGVAAHHDKFLANPWGIAYSPTGVFWIADNQTGVSTLYNGQGAVLTGNQPFIIPPPTGSPAGTLSSPDGIVFNGTNGFNVSAGGNSGPAFFIFATEDGTISGWNPGVGGQDATLVVDNSQGGTGAVYKGLAMAKDLNQNLLYATNFRAGTVEVYNSQFTQVIVKGAFTDPNLPSGYAPFGIQNINGNLYVTYALQNAAKHDSVAGVGNGYIDEYSPDGTLIRRVASQGTLNAPWGMAVAPTSWGPLAGDLLVGNFGDGHIQAFDLTQSNPDGTAQADGLLNNASGKPITIDGLWALKFGNGHQAGPTNTLFFTAGIDGEKHGLFGSLTLSNTVGGDAGVKSAAGLHGSGLLALSPMSHSDALAPLPGTGGGSSTGPAAGADNFWATLGAQASQQNHNHYQHLSGPAGPSAADALFAGAGLSFNFNPLW
jgi:uncharacterized protein (TIGR03118 family)